MTRLVGVRAVCDGCLSAPATIFCVDHRLVLCPKCNIEQHPLPTNHQRVDLTSSVTALPFCEHCDDSPATVYCQSEGITLCDKCDRAVHAPGQQHTRTPIESTLRHRAVEFRGRRRQPSNKFLKPIRNDSNPTQPQPQQSPSENSTAEATHRNGSTKFAKPTPPRPKLQKSTSPKRRASKLIQKRNARKETRPSPNVQPERSPPPAFALNASSPNTSRLQPDVLEQDHYTNLFFPGSSNYSLSNMSNMPPGSLPDPLLGDTMTAFRDNNTYVDASTAPSLEFDSILTYGTIDLNSNNGLDGVSGANGSLSQTPLRRDQGSSEQQLSQPAHNGEPNTGRVPPNTPQPNVMAAAAVAAGEQFLLTSGSSGSGSSGEKSTPPLNDGPDPARVALVATAAAASAAVDLGHGPRTQGFAVSVAEALEGVTGEHGEHMNEIEPQETGSGASGIERTGLIEDANNGQESTGGLTGTTRSTKRHSEAGLGSGRGAGQAFQGLQAMQMYTREGHLGHSEARQRQMFDEVMSGLEPEHQQGLTDSGMNRAVRYDMKPENVISRSGGLFGQLGDEDMLQRSTDPMGDLEMGNDFGFDTVDLGQFEHNAPPGMPFGLPDDRGKDAGWEEG